MSDTNSNSENCSTESQSQRNVQPFHDEQRLRRLYHEKGLTQAEIGERFGVTRQCIKYWMDEHGIEARLSMSKRDRDRNISVSIREDGYAQFKIPNFDSDDLDDREPIYTSLYRHQMVALLTTDDDGDWLFDLADVFHEDAHVHHYMNSDARVDHQDNLDVLPDGQHQFIHGGYNYIENVEFVLGEIFDDYDGEPDQDEISETGNVDMNSVEDDSDETGAMAD